MKNDVRRGGEGMGRRFIGSMFVGGSEGIT